MGLDLRASLEVVPLASELLTRQQVRTSRGPESPVFGLSESQEPASILHSNNLVYIYCSYFLVWGSFRSRRERPDDTEAHRVGRIDDLDLVSMRRARLGGSAGERSPAYEAA